MSEQPTRPDDLPELATLSAKIGADPHIIQAAGGNTSIKDGDVMWIKASGTLLASALEKNVFVPVDLPLIRGKIGSGDPVADKPATFLLGDEVLRPSIETSLHAVFRHRVVIHVHCVDTIAHAIREDREALLKEKLKGLDWAIAPYAKPGAHLANHVRQLLTNDTNVVILANHGLIVAADSIGEAKALLDEVRQCLRVEESPKHQPDVAALEACAPGLYQVPDASHVVHQLAFGERRIAQATRGSMYPDHVLFCGIGAQALDAADMSSLDEENAPVFLIVPGKGVLMRQDATDSGWALTRCLADVMLRVPDEAELTYLSEQQNYELLNWDSEKYRLSLSER